MSGSSSDGGGSAVGVGLPQLVDQMSLGSPSASRAQGQTLGSPGSSAGDGIAAATGESRTFSAVSCRVKLFFWVSAGIWLLNTELAPALRRGRF